MCFMISYLGAMIPSLPAATDCSIGAFVDARAANSDDEIETGGDQAEAERNFAVATRDDFIDKMFAEHKKEQGNTHSKSACSTSSQNGRGAKGGHGRKSTRSKQAPRASAHKKRAENHPMEHETEAARRSSFLPMGLTLPEFLSLFLFKIGGLFYVWYMYGDIVLGELREILQNPALFEARLVPEFYPAPQRRIGDESDDES